MHDSLTTDEPAAVVPGQNASDLADAPGASPVPGVIYTMRATDMSQRVSLLSRLRDLLFGDEGNKAIDVQVIATYASSGVSSSSFVRVGALPAPSAAERTEPGERAARHLIDDLERDRDRSATSSAGPASTVIDDVRDLLADIDVEAGARRVVLDVPMLTSAAVADALGTQGKNRRETASRLRTNGTLVGIPNPDGRGYLHPVFQLDLAHRHVHPVVAEVNRATGAANDPWGVASWWVSHHGRLGALAPMDLIGTDREQDLLVMNGLAPAENASDASDALAAIAALDAEHR